eukprot:m.126996 g.126996  ORF g.126996 m.126996 type:complete len:251 (+) comp15790_c0_seq4:873-1625(+)
MLIIHTEMAVRSYVAGFVSLAILFIGCTANATVTVDWNTTEYISRTTTTLQVVANPLLNVKTSPVAKQFQASLKALNADLVRYVPWYPYPKVGVAELDPPNYATKTTSWNFTDILPQLELFMNATYGNGKRVVPNFSTQPTWMYNTKDWSYPTDPNTVDRAYPKGDATANTTKLVAQYYGRLLSWLVTGEFTDEFGVTHRGGPKYNLTHWEVGVAGVADSCLLWRLTLLQPLELSENLGRSITSPNTATG